MWNSALIQIQNLFLIMICDSLLPDNPCPELGNIVTIKLSEREEPVPQRDGTLLALFVETHFQMNYNTGEWKVITKPPKLDPSISA
jgi:negative elongation factor A